MLTESKQWTRKLSEALEDLVLGPPRMEVTCVEWWGTRMEYATCGRFGGLGLKTRVEVSGRNGRHVVASRSLRQGEAIS
jgi:hypothetical protein